MASIRLFGRGKTGSAAGAGGAPAVDAALIAAALADLSTASVSSTWRCRHGAGLTSIGEGAVDFGARRSRATVIRGKSTYEYVRDGSGVFRAAVPLQDPAAAAAANDAAAPHEAEDGEDDEDAALEPGLEAGDGDGDGPHDEDADADAPAEGIAGGQEALAAAGGGDGEDGEEAEEAAPGEDGREGGRDDGQGDGAAQAPDSAHEPDAQAGAGADKDGDALAWQGFSEHDVCGPHAYAEPAVLAQAVRRAGAVQARKPEQFDGVLLSAYCVTAKPKPADPDKLLARLARQLRDHGANTVVVTAFVETAADDAEIDLDADDDDDGARKAPRVVRLRVELPHWTPADDPTADHSVSVDLFELGDPVQIEAPDRDRVARRTARTCADLSLF